MHSSILLTTTILALSNLISGAAISSPRQPVSVSISQFSGATCQQTSSQIPFSTFASHLSTTSTSGDLNDWPRSVKIIMPPSGAGSFQTTMTDSQSNTKTFKNAASAASGDTEAVTCETANCWVCTTVDSTGADGPSWVKWAAEEES